MNKITDNQIKTGYFLTKTGIPLYLAENERFYYKDPKGQWFVYYNNIFIPTNYYYIKPINNDDIRTKNTNTQKKKKK